MVGRETVPDVANFSCWTSMFQHPSTPSVADVVKAACSSLLGIIVIVVNSIFIVAVNGRRHVKHLSFQPRYLLTSMALSDLLKGLIVVPLSVYPTLYHCFPYPRLLCAVQAILLPLLHHQAALTLSLLALDRYCCLLHPSSYQNHASRPLCVIVVVLSWAVVVGIHAGLYVPSPQFYFNHLGSQSCEPFHTVNSKIIIVACAVYFPTTMITMYCYGTVFHVARTSLHRLVCATVSAPEILGGTLVEKMLMKERRESMRTCRVMAVVSLSFIILITPWTLRQIITACTNSRIPGGLDYGVWVVSVGGGNIIIFIFWLFSPAFRRAMEETLHNRVCCGNVYYDEGDDVSLSHLSHNGEHLWKAGQHQCTPHTPACPVAAHAHSGPSELAHTPAPLHRSMGALSCNATPRHLVNGRTPGPAGRNNGAGDIEVGEKFWGEILERTVSSSSLQNLQRIYRNGSSGHPELRLNQASNWHI
ncbi:trace amine-associated receptor 1-like [Penaeus japonicus]|uniref:trace amine-associated receptor 1-like n=1 Tax=Penaeus japonicus TaxID=27405 RepID=UPI001C716A34|nr:trace amine-associated receptor 1-like [Penaeus japonicus]